MIVTVGAGGRILFTFMNLYIYDYTTKTVSLIDDYVFATSAYLQLKKFGLLNILFRFHFMNVKIGGLN